MCQRRLPYPSYRFRIYDIDMKYERMRRVEGTSGSETTSPIIQWSHVLAYRQASFQATQADSNALMMVNDSHNSDKESTFEHMLIDWDISGRAPNILTTLFTQEHQLELPQWVTKIARCRHFAQCVCISYARFGPDGNY